MHALLIAYLLCVLYGFNLVIAVGCLSNKISLLKAWSELSYIVVWCVFYIYGVSFLSIFFFFWSFEIKIPGCEPTSV